MKKSLIVFVTVLLVGTAVVSQTKAQSKNYTPFKWHLIGIGAAIPSGSGVTAGAYLATEPSYLITDNISVGLRFESALTLKNDLVTGDAKAAAVGSYLATGDYYFSKESATRFFAGLGLGFAKAAAVAASSNNSSGVLKDVGVGSASGFGGLIRAGIDYHHVRFLISYNMAPTSKLEHVAGTATTLAIPDTKYDNNYIGIGFSVFIGGTYKK